MTKTTDAPTPRYKQLNVRVRVDVIKNAKMSALTWDMPFGRYVEKVLLDAHKANKKPGTP